jgi:hypothetical protein
MLVLYSTVIGIYLKGIVKKIVQFIVHCTGIEKMLPIHNLLSNPGCESGLIRSGSGSKIFPQSGSTKFLNPDPMRIRIQKGKFEDKFFF